MSRLDSTLLGADKIFNKISAGYAQSKSSPLVKESLGYAKRVVSGGWGGLRNQSLTKLGMYAGGGAIAGAGQDMAFNNGRDLAGGAVKGALLGGLGRSAWVGGRGAFNPAKAGFKGAKGAWGDAFGRMRDAAAFNNMAARDTARGLKMGDAPARASLGREFLGI